MTTITQTARQATKALVIGASGGIGAALVQGLTERGCEVESLSRCAEEQDQPHDVSIDLACESSIQAAAVRLADRGPFTQIIVATGLLHDSAIRPEKSVRDLDPVRLARLFAVNAIGPALVAKHFVNLLPKQGRCVFAALSARVGSIGDNKKGGWYGYRASKAALNMVLKTLSIELARTRPDAICVGLHPGTVDTHLSKPFQSALPVGRLFSPDQAGSYLLDVLEQLTPAETGRCFAWDGQEVCP